MNNIIEHEHNGQRWLFVDGFPEGLTPKVKGNGLGCSYSVKPYFVTHINLPSSGKGWQIHADTSNLTDEQAIEMVPLFEVAYALSGTYLDYIHSLIRSKGGDANKRYVVLKAVK